MTCFIDQLRKESIPLKIYKKIESSLFINCKRSPLIKNSSKNTWNNSLIDFMSERLILSEDLWEKMESWFQIFLGLLILRAEAFIVNFEHICQTSKMELFCENSLTLPAPIPDEEKKINLTFLFSHFFVVPQKV